MAKEQDQIQDKIEEPITQTAEQIAEKQRLEAEETKAVEDAAKVSDDFDKKLDEADDVEETPSDDEPEPEKAAEKDDEETPSEEPGADDATAKTESDISDEMRKRATDLGMIDEDIAEFATDDELERSVNIMENIVKDDQKAEQARAASKPAQPESKKGDEQKPAKESSELVIKNEDEMDPAIVKVLKAQHAKTLELEAKVSAQDAKLQAEEDRLAADRHAETLGRFDKRIDDLGEKYHDTFGKGNTAEMSTRSPLCKNRHKVRVHMYALAKGLHEAGQNIPAEERLFDMALHNVFQKKVESVTGGKLHAKTSTRAGQRIGKPSTKKTGKPTRQQGAVQVSEDFDALYDASEK